MSEELRKSAELIVAMHPGGRSAPMIDARKLARAYLADYPADDELPIDADFVRSLGPVIREDDCIIVQVHSAQHLKAQVIWESDWTKQKWRCVVRIYDDGISGAPIVECSTRGQLRALLIALGIEVKS